MSAPLSVSSNPTGPLNGVHLIDVKEVARRLDLSERTVWRLNSTGKLPRPISLGGKSKKWRAEEISAWVAAGCPARNAWEAMSKRVA